MIGLPPSVRIFLCTEPTDMRRSFDALAMLTETVVGENPFSGHLFVFHNRIGDKVKILYWDRDGLVQWYKRREKGKFVFPATSCNRLEVEADELVALLGGLDLQGAKRRPRFTPPGAPVVPAKVASL
jgi:transposase